MILSDWAAVAINNARLYEASERRREDAEKAIRGLEATRDVAVAIGGEIGLEHVLELIVKRGRALVGARSLVIMLREGHELVIQASAGGKCGGDEAASMHRGPSVGGPQSCHDLPGMANAVKRRRAMRMAYGACRPGFRLALPPRMW